MKSIYLQRRHALGAESARGLAQRVADELESRYGVQSRWADSVLHFQRAGITGRLTVEDERLTLEAELGLMMSAFRDVIERSVADRLDRELADRS